MPPSASNRPFAEVAIEVAQACLRQLVRSDSLADRAVVHELRVATKRLRAAWRLVASQAGRELARERRRKLADLSAKLAGTRELAVLTRLTQRLAAATADGRAAEALAQVAACLAQRMSDGGHPVTNAEALREEIQEDLAEEITGWQGLAHRERPPRRRVLRRALRRSIRRARRDARRAARSLDAELWHDWRKTVNRLRYQREFIASSAGREPGKSDARLRRLGARLGRRHDLANLTALVDSLLAAGGLAAADHRLVRRLIAGVEAGVIRRCRRLGKRTFLR